MRIAVVNNWVPFFTGDAGHVAGALTCKFVECGHEAAVVRRWRAIYTNSSVTGDRLRKVNDIGSTVLYPPLLKPAHFVALGESQIAKAPREHLRERVSDANLRQRRMAQKGRDAKRGHSRYSAREDPLLTEDDYHPPIVGKGN